MEIMANYDHTRPAVITLSSDSEGEEIDVVGKSGEGGLSQPPPPSLSIVTMQSAVGADSSPLSRPQSEAKTNKTTKSISPSPSSSGVEVEANASSTSTSLSMSDIKSECSDTSPGFRNESTHSMPTSQSTSGSSGLKTKGVSTPATSLNPPYSNMDKWQIIAYMEKIYKAGKDAKITIIEKDKELAAASAEIAMLKENLEMAQRNTRQMEESEQAKVARLAEAAKEIARLKDALKLEQNKNKEKDQSEKTNVTRLAEDAVEMVRLKGALQLEQNENKVKDIDIANLRDALSREEKDKKVNLARLYDEIKKLKLCEIEYESKLSTEESLRKSMEEEKDAQLNEAVDATRKLEAELQEAKSNSKNVEAQAAGMVDEARIELTQLWSHVSDILRLIDVEDTQTEANTEAGPVPFSVLLQTVDNLKQQWDESMKEAKEDTKIVKEEVKKTNDALMELVTMLDGVALLGTGTSAEDDGTMT